MFACLLFILNFERNKQQKQAMLIKETQDMMELDYMDISSWDYETPADHHHNMRMRIRNLQAGPGDEDRVGKEERIEPSQYDQIMQIVFCSVFFILFR
jgi:hypothetical protein